MTSVAAPGRREQAKSQRRAELERAALELFAERGYENTTIDAIAAAAGVSPRTFFRYFLTKEEVIFAIEEDELSVLQEAAATAPRELDNVAAARHAVTRFAEQVEGRRDDALARGRIVETSPSLVSRSCLLQRKWEETLADGLAARAGPGASSRDFRIRLVAAGAVATFAVALSVWRDGEGTPSLQSYVNEAWSLLR